MEVIIVKYVQLVCISIFMTNNSNCAQLMSSSEEANTFKVSACAARCLQNETENYNLTQCYDQCDKNLESLNDVKTVYSQTNSTFDLFCRGSRKLVIQFDQTEDDGHVENEKFIYMLVVQESDMPFVDRYVYISDGPMIELHDLKPSQSYNISASIVSSNDDVRFLGTEKFTTLKPDYEPANVTDIWVEKQEAIQGDGEYVNVVIGWHPALDKTCLYQMILHGTGDDGDMKIADKESPNLYQHKFSNLKYSAKYAVAVRGINFENMRLESSTLWQEFRTINCAELLGDMTVCKPNIDIPFDVESYNTHDTIFIMKITWNKTEILPDYYHVEITDAHNKYGEEPHSYTVAGNQTSFYNSEVNITGSECLITLIAYFQNGKYNSDNYKIVQLTHIRRNTYPTVVITALIVVAFIFLIISLLVWQGRVNFFIKAFSQKQLESMDLDLIKSISNRTMLESIAELTRDSMMEVERENITLLEALGEGAFGLVKKAIVVKGDGNHQVAVKMLKNSANIEDIKQFHQEISVMKSVGQHPNIVSIIGHCTSNIEELMLLTEYCDAGSLLDLLRNEFSKQLSFYDKKVPVSPQKYPDSMHNFDSNEKNNLSYKNIGCSSRLFVVNQMYDDLNNNDNKTEMHHHEVTLKAIEMTATNALYLQLNDNDPSQVVVEISEHPCDSFLSSSDLISFARQVCDGMNFLAKKRVVHRDLAARNILVCSDKTIKIADFGLSRDIYQDNIYRKVGNGKLPIKWLAIESMTHQVYTSQSDVWSLGILLYEIVTLGATPYPSVGAEQILKILNTGYRMEKPIHCHQSLYDVMMSCWHVTPTDRPTFEQLSDQMNHFLKIEKSWDERFIDLPKLFDKCSNEMNYLIPRNYLKPIA